MNFKMQNRNMRDNSKELTLGQDKVVVLMENAEISTTSSARARMLLAKKKATVKYIKPFTILMKRKKMKIIHSNHPDFEIFDIGTSNITTLMEFGIDELSLANMRKFFAGGRSERHDKAINDSIKTAKEELFKKADDLKADAVSDLKINVQLAQIKSDVSVTVVCQACFLHSKNK